MRKTFWVGIALAFSACIVVQMDAASAADPAFCRQYAKAALNQVRGGLSNPGCAARMHGPRWSSDFSVHYRWCRGASYAAAGSERDARTDYLRACR